MRDAAKADAAARAKAARAAGRDAPKADKVKDFKGGFSSRFKLTEDRLRVLVADVEEIRNVFAQVREFAGSALSPARRLPD